MSECEENETHNNYCDHCFTCHDCLNEHELRLESEIEKLKEKLIETAGELSGFIDRHNEQLKAEISCLDLDPPEYYDHQTVHEAMQLANQ